MRVSISARTRRRDVDLGMRTFAIDIEVDAIGTVAGSAAGRCVIRRAIHENMTLRRLEV
jgi:hypothetical protein